MQSSEVSVLMATYNAAHEVGKAIRSIQEQTMTNWELVICDDGSTDDTPSVLKTFAEQDPRIRVLLRSENRGLGACLNTCLEAAHAELCARQDADDYSYPGRLAAQVAVFEKEPELAIVGTAMECVDEDGRAWSVSSVIERPEPRDLVSGPCFAHVTVMYRRSAVIEVGGYDATMRRDQDYDLWFRLLLGRKARNLREPLVRVCFPRSSYKRRRFRYRIWEARTRWRGYRRTRAPWYAYAYVLKPLLAGMVPPTLMWRYHVMRGRHERARH